MWYGFFGNGSNVPFPFRHMFISTCLSHFNVQKVFNFLINWLKVLITMNALICGPIIIVVPKKLF